ncbi:MAG: methyl-accepting chemotaxis protein [Gemmatimonadaceae bacterium]|nr:methyl-accepting chemotaxis protein [Gemmatimonadaceae bacterium]
MRPPAYQSVSFLEIRTLRARLRAVAVLGATGILAVAVSAVLAMRGATPATTNVLAVWRVPGATSVLVVTALFLVAVLGFAFIVAKQLGERLSRVAQHVELVQRQGVAQVAAALEALSRGEQVTLSTPAYRALRDDIPDELGAVSVAVDRMADECKSSLEACSKAQDAIGTAVQEIARVAAQARQGDLTVQARIGALQGQYAEVLTGVDGVVQAVREPLNEACRALEAVAERNLETRMTGTYAGDFARMQGAFNTAVQELAQTIGQVRASAVQVDHAAGQLASGSTQLANGASQQAASAEEIGTALTELTTRASVASREAIALRERATEAGARVDAGSAAMDALRGDMVRIKQSADASQRIVRTIDEIAFQTNLLALNAAVEAARAGDAGRGFAVVADEVRQLALRAAEAARQTTTLIEEEIRNVDAGVAREQQVREALTATRVEVTAMRTSIDDLVSGAAQQVDGVRQVSNGVQAMSEVTQQVAASSEESAASAEELLGQAAQLNTLVQEFRTRDAERRGSDGLSLDARRRRAA